MSEHPTKEEFFDLYHYKITGPRGKEVQTHVQSCQHCTQYLQDVKKVESSFATLSFSAPSEKTLKNIIKYADKAMTKSKPFWVFQKARVLGLAMSVVVIVGFGIFYYHNQAQFQFTTATQDEKGRLERKLENADFDKEGMGIMVGSSSSPLAEGEDTPSPPVPKTKKQANQKEKDLFAINQSTNESINSEINGDDNVEEEMSPTEKFNFANQLKEKGECERAAKLYESIYSTQDKPFKPQDTLLFNWASCLEKLGKKVEAKKQLLELKKINSNYPGLEVFLQRL